MWACCIMGAWYTMVYLEQLFCNLSTDERLCSFTVNVLSIEPKLADPMAGADDITHIGFEIHAPLGTSLLLWALTIRISSDLEGS